MRRTLPLYLSLLVCLACSELWAEDAPPAAAKTDETAQAAKAEDKNPWDEGVQLKEQPLPVEVVASGVACLGGTIFPPAQQYTGKMPLKPEELIQQRVGVFFIEPQIVHVIFKSKADAPGYDRVILDTNADGELGDEKVLSLEEGKTTIPVELTIGEKKAKMDFMFPQEEGEGSRLCQPTMPQGEITLGGKKIRCALFNTDPAQPYALRSTVVFLDLNNDGKFHLNWDDPLKIEGFQLTSMFFAAGAFLQSAVAPDGSKLLLKEYAGASGEFGMDLLPAASQNAALYSFTLLPEGGDGGDILRILSSSNPVKVPLGTYALLDGSVYDKDRRPLLSIAYPEFKLTEKGLKLPVKKLNMTVIADLEDDMIAASQQTKGEGDLLLNFASTRNEEDTGPKVEVFIADNDGKIPDGAKPILTGVMEYG